MRDAGGARDEGKEDLAVPRDIFDDAHDAIDRVVGAEIAQQAFGIVGAQRRGGHLDPVVAHAVQMLHGVTAPKMLFDRASVGERWHEAAGLAVVPARAFSHQRFGVDNPDAPAVH